MHRADVLNAVVPDPPIGFARDDEGTGGGARRQQQHDEAKGKYERARSRLLFHLAITIGRIISLSS